MQRRVVVTGIGVVSPIGLGKEDFFEGLVRTRNGVGKITLFDSSKYKCQIAAQVPDFDLKEFGIDKHDAARRDRFSVFGEVAAELAYRDSGLDFSGIEDKVGIIISSGIGGLETLYQEQRVLLEKGPGRISPMFVPKLMPNAAAGNFTISHKLQGPSYSVASACASGNNALISGLQDILLGDADIMLAGGAEAVISPVAIAGFTNMRALTTFYNDSPEKASRPFDKNRSGFVMGEGSGVMVLEELEHAKKRGAHIYAEFVGYGMSSDGRHITEPDVEGQALAMKRALQKAQISQDEIDYINAHGTSTPLNDKTETAAIKIVLGEHARKIYVSSTKSQIGHTLGAAGAIEGVACVLALERGFLPATINYETPDPECDLNYVPNVPIEKKIRVAMNDSFGFGGHNTTTVFRKFE